MALPCFKVGLYQEAHVHFQPFLSPDGQGPLLERIQPRPQVWAHSMTLLTDSMDWCWGSEPLPGPRVPPRPNGCGLCRLAAPSHPDGLARAPTGGGSSSWFTLRGLLAPKGLPPPLKPSHVSSVSPETGRCLSRAKASPPAQLSCSKAGGVESCSLACPGHTLFTPGNRGCPREGAAGRGAGLRPPGSSPHSLLLSGKGPQQRTPGPGH